MGLGVGAQHQQAVRDEHAILPHMAPLSGVAHLCGKHAAALAAASILPHLQPQAFCQLHTGGFRGAGSACSARTASSELHPSGGGSGSGGGGGEAGEAQYPGCAQSGFHQRQSNATVPSAVRRVPARADAAALLRLGEPAAPVFARQGSPWCWKGNGNAHARMPAPVLWGGGRRQPGGTQLGQGSLWAPPLACRLA